MDKGQHFKQYPEGYCWICECDVSDENHYHCGSCGGQTSMMGHVDLQTLQLKCVARSPLLGAHSKKAER